MNLSHFTLHSSPFTGPLKVSVIICCYTMERLKDIHEAVESVLAQTLEPHEVILAVDHNKQLYEILKSCYSTDQISQSTEVTQQTQQTEPILSTPQIKVVLNEGAPGLSETRNVGIRASRGDIVAFIDDDAVADRNWLGNLTKHFDEPAVVAVGGKALPIWPEGKGPKWFPEEFDFIIGCTQHKRLLQLRDNQIRNVSGCSMSFRKAVFQTVGLWESNLGRREGMKGHFNPAGGEEAELCLKIRSKMPDKVILFAPDAVVHHKVSSRRATPAYVFNFCFREGITRARLRRLTSGFTGDPLAAERLFVRCVLLRSTLQRMKRFYKPPNLVQLAVILINVMLIGAGYVVGKYAYR